MIKVLWNTISKLETVPRKKKTNKQTTKNKQTKNKQTNKRKTKQTNKQKPNQKHGPDKKPTQRAYWSKEAK